ncbi:hypothetical protein TPHA_0F02920 [Tetrapisispora phaffii CBS 4417]|uniref:Heme oxygenase n=1 Tax=Tetrapisispora phaffii (strain ATCC 24235 / CBS 4417 / NBRC 1672 / NRRL Y-8282 / UCD 70-5) TaxID=1071381 RepID=G8BUI7_TETPH|nr:hypothetical protein TPHA_0F02920 [Tetrapisispora phaffii CBS 4417]CCE63773.1 hypothetical protein TPHA_0F02920 [Tetrapisispora phaffii CBS 4417]
MSNVKIIPSPTDVKALANRINFETRDFHNKIGAFMSIRLALALRHGFIYRQGLVAFYHIFGTIENEIDNLLNTLDSELDSVQIQTKKILKSFYVNEFRRKDNLLQDLTVLYYPEFKGNRQDVLDFLNSETFNKENYPELNFFTDYIKDTTKEKPYTIIAYCHVLYLALFAGGKIMKSNVLKNVGLFPKFDHMSHEEVTNQGSNFFRFTQEDTADFDSKLRFEYKKNYELSTRDELNEMQKNDIIEVSKNIFVMLENVIAEIGAKNRTKLMGGFTLKTITYLVEEWKYNEKLTKTNKQIILLIISIINILITYTIIKWFLS